MPLRGIIFDVDGTLAETEEVHRRAFNQAFADEGKSWRWSEIDYAALLTTTGGRERISRYMVEVGLDPDPDAVAATHARKNELYGELVARGAVEPRRGVLSLITQARARDIKLAIATTTSRSNLAALLRHAFGPDAATWFATIVVGEDVTAKKPDPEVYRRALAELALRASDCVAIEDSRNGLEAALRCGIATVVTPSRYTASERFDGAALVCADLFEDIDISGLESLISRPTRGPFCTD